MKLRKEKSFLLWAGVCALAIFAPACGSDGGGSDDQCPVEELDAGVYSFNLGTVEDDCPGVNVGTLITLIDPGPYSGIALPSFAELEQGPVLDTVDLPVIGPVEVQLALQGGVVRLTLPGGAEEVLVLPDCTLAIGATGTLCPVSGSEVEATLVITLEGAEGDGCGLISVGLPCSATINLSGVKQAG